MLKRPRFPAFLINWLCKSIWIIIVARLLLLSKVASRGVSSSVFEQFREPIMMSRRFCTWWLWGETNGIIIWGLVHLYTTQFRQQLK